MYVYRQQKLLKCGLQTLICFGGVSIKHFGMNAHNVHVHVQSMYGKYVAQQYYGKSSVQTCMHVYVDQSLEGRPCLINFV